MEQKNIIGILMGMAIGAAIVLVTLFLNARLNGTQPTLEQASEFLTEMEASNSLPGQPPPNAGKDLCAVLSQEEVNRLVPSAKVDAIERSPIEPFSNCAYFGERKSVPVLAFNHNLPDLAQLKDAQRKIGASLRDISGIGDGAFLANIPTVPGTDLSLRVIFFRVGDFGYSVSSFELTESQLRSIAGVAAGKLR
jgi:hypothetical protein